METEAPQLPKLPWAKLPQALHTDIGNTNLWSIKLRQGLSSTQEPRKTRQDVVMIASCTSLSSTQEPRKTRQDVVMIASRTSLSSTQEPQEMNNH
ncbi:MAG: hypothetical protein HQK66_06155 [Desulfamplus sp.]|nr:hypothetical protein [Desulfamplus sp.]